MFWWLILNIFHLSLVFVLLTLNWKMFAGIPPDKRQKSKALNGGNKKTKHANFSEKQTFLTHWYAHVREIRPFLLSLTKYSKNLLNSNLFTHWKLPVQKIHILLVRHQQVVHVVTRCDQLTIRVEKVLRWNLRDNITFSQGNLWEVSFQISKIIKNTSTTGPSFKIKNRLPLQIWSYKFCEIWKIP